MYISISELEISAFLLVDSVLFHYLNLNYYFNFSISVWYFRYWDCGNAIGNFSLCYVIIVLSFYPLNTSGNWLVCLEEKCKNTSGTLKYLFTVDTLVLQNLEENCHKVLNKITHQGGNRLHLQNAPCVYEYISLLCRIISNHWYKSVCICTNMSLYSTG